MEASSQLAVSLLPVAVRLGETVMVLALTTLVYIVVPWVVWRLSDNEWVLRRYVRNGTLSNWVAFNIKGVRDKGVPDKPSRISELGQKIQYDATVKRCRTVSSGTAASRRKTRDQATSRDAMREAYNPLRDQAAGVDKSMRWCCQAEEQVGALGAEVAGSWLDALVRDSFRSYAKRIEEQTKGVEDRSEEWHKRTNRILGWSELAEHGSVCAAPPTPHNATSDSQATAPSAGDGDARPVLDRLQEIVEENNKRLSASRRHLEATQEQWSKLVDWTRNELLPRLDGLLDNEEMRQDIQRRLADCEIEIINPMHGEKSEPSLHEEFTRGPATPDCRPGHVIRTIRRGYLWKSTFVFRAAIIAVAVADEQQVGAEET